jgi:muconolactone D-isomerase
VQFLVKLEYAFPFDMEGAAQEKLLRSESVRGSELAEHGSLLAIWRIPGCRANYGVWEARDATELHDLVSSLPLWPYATIAVTTLARHPLAGKCRGLAPGLACE